MTEADRHEFVVAMAALAAAYGGGEFTEPQYEAYWIGLSSLPIEAVKAAVVRAITESRFLPVPAELRELAGEEPPSLRAELGWAAVRRAIREHGHYQAVRFSDGLVNATVRAIGGWIAICTAAPEQFPWYKKDFTRTYLELAKHGATPAEQGPLLGALESERVRNVPVRLGLPAQLAAPPPRLALAGSRPDEEDR